MTDTIANMFSIIKNGYGAKKKLVEIPHAKELEQIATVLHGEGFIDSVEVNKENKFKKLIIKLKYVNKQPALVNIERISKPGLRVYVGRQNIPYVLGGIGKVIISTSLGILSGKQAKSKKIGGELICKVW